MVLPRDKGVTEKFRFTNPKAISCEVCVNNKKER